MKPGRKLEFRKAFSPLGEKPHEFSRVIDPGEEANGRVRALYSRGAGFYAETATEERVELLIATSNEGDAENLRAALSAGAPDCVHVFARKNLGGDAATWLVLASVLAPQIPAVLAFVRELADRKRVSSIKVGDVEIVNPTPEQVEQLLADRAPQAPSG